MDYSSWIEGTRFNGLRCFVRDVALKTGMAVKRLDSEKGFIRERVYFTVSGNEQQRQRFCLLINETVDEHNS